MSQSLEKYDFDLNTCDLEPIHLIGSIQPHGFLLAISESDLIIQHCSANTEIFLGMPAEKLIGTSLEELIGTGCCSQIAEAWLSHTLEAISPFIISTTYASHKRTFIASVKSSEGLLLLEAEPSGPRPPIISNDSTYKLISSLPKLLSASEIPNLLSAAAREIQQLTDFDRVLIYRFNSEWNGTVIAEQRRDFMCSYMNHRFPASDIPRQARELYVKNPIRVLVDVDAMPSPILPAINKQTGKPIDLSFSTLRSMSPMHIEYLKNMGVCASASISIVKDEKLWALIACHHKLPKLVDYKTRALLQLLGQLISMRISRIEQANQTDRLFSLKSLQDKLRRSLTEEASLGNALTRLSAEVLELASAKGFTLFLDETPVSVGLIPPPEALSSLRQWLNDAVEAPIVYTDNLSLVFPQAESYIKEASGLLAVPISRHKGYWLVWFRPEVLQEIHWAGNPEKPVRLDEAKWDIHPRQSFELWKEQVVASAEPWHKLEIDMAIELGNALHDLLLEREVRESTAKLTASEGQLAVQYLISECLNNSATISLAAQQIIAIISEKLLGSAAYGGLWIESRDGSSLSCMGSISADFIESNFGWKLATYMYASNLNQISHMELLTKFPEQSLPAESEHLCAFGVPINGADHRLGLLVFMYDATCMSSSKNTELIASIGQQIGHYISKHETEKENQRLAQLVLYSADAIISLTTAAIISSWNKGAERLYGWTASQAIGKEYSMLLPPDKADEALTLIHSLAQQGWIENFETMHVRNDGKHVYLSQSWSAIYDNPGKLVAISISSRDISEKKEAEKRVSEFYSMVSHELRTPLTAIRASLGLMEGGLAGKLPPKAEGLVQVGRKESDRLIRLINDILDIRKIEAGKFELKLSSWPAHELIEVTIEAIKSMAVTNKVQIKTEENFSGDIRCDRDRFIQVLTNLLSNAIKFSPSGGKIVVATKPVRNSSLKISISDQGHGIAQEQREKLFEKFQQLDSSDSRLKGGTGLGLALSKEIVEKHKGRMGFESSVGKGSTFWFEIPLANESLDVSADREPPAKVSDVLFVQDNEAASQLLTETLLSDGFAVNRATSLTEAQDFLSKSIPDAILLDIQLPDGNILDFTHNLKQKADMKNIPVVILAGSRPERAGFGKPMIVEWITKPCDEIRLEMALKLALQRSIATVTVLVIEDESTTEEVIFERLKTLGFNAHYAPHGESAVHYLRSSNPDLVVIDFGIPNSEALAVAPAARQLPVKASPIIIYSNRNLTIEDKERLTKGLTKHLTKVPTGEAEFALAVRALIDDLLLSPEELAKA